MLLELESSNMDVLYWCCVFQQAFRCLKDFFWQFLFGLQFPFTVKEKFSEQFWP